MLVNVYEAKTRLSALLECVQAGEEVIIAKAGTPVARLLPFGAAKRSRSGVTYGALTPARLKLAADFHSPLKDDDLLGS